MERTTSSSRTNHKPIKTGTLGQLLEQVAEHHGMTRDELIDRLEL